MRFKYWLETFVAGMAIFSMFFGGGNLTFPLWTGSLSSSTLLAFFGFVCSGVLLPFLGIAIILFFKGNYEQCFESFGKTFGRLLVFVLLLFWIPLGSAPRCNQLAYGAYCCSIDWKVPLWIYSALYSVCVYLLTLKKQRMLDILGNIITPVLIFSLFFIIISVLKNFDPRSVYEPNVNWSDFYQAFIAGYSTMDFIAAIFFASTVISIVKDKQKSNFNIKFVRNACVFAVVLLSLVYLGMISIGKIHAGILSSTPRDQLLAVIGRAMFSERFQILIFIVITLSALSTSMALTLVFSDYLRTTIFKERFRHHHCLLISTSITFLLSIIGFERLAILISYVMSALYPILLIVTILAFFKASRATLIKEPKF